MPSGYCANRDRLQRAFRPRSAGPGPRRRRSRLRELCARRQLPLSALYLCVPTVHAPAVHPCVHEPSQTRTNSICWMQSGSVSMDKRVQRANQPSRLGLKLIVPMLLFAGGLGAATWWLSESLVLRQTVSEGRTVADMVENIGKWASQYGGVHVRTQGANAKIPGNFLTRSVYSVSGSDNQVLQGSRVEAAVAERDALERVEA